MDTTEDRSDSTGTYLLLILDANSPVLTVQSSRSSALAWESFLDGVAQTSPILATVPLSAFGQSPSGSGGQISMRASDGSNISDQLTLQADISHGISIECLN
jgi:hypothetical protein